MNDTPDPDPIDLAVGLRIRALRKEAGMSQTALGDALGVSFQQIQKYERGANRVSASKLYEIARALQTSVAYFFDGLADTVDPALDLIEGREFMHELVMTPEGLELASLFPKLKRGRVRRRVLDLVKALAEDEDEQLP